MGDTSLYVYQHYKSLWKEVDNNNLTHLSNHPQLMIKLNQKEQGVTPLFLACQRKNSSIIHFLLQCGADPNIECKGLTPLYLCCLYAEEESVEHLLDFGANPSTSCTTRKITPLHLAASKGLITTTQLLLKRGADVNALSPKYGTPLHVAVSKNHKNIFRLLMSHGAALNTTKEEGDTALHIACRLGFVEIARTLLDQPSINATLKEKVEGNTCLHLACFHNQEVIALMLIQRYPDLIYIRNDSERQTPLFYASDSIRKSIKNAFTNRMPGFPESLNNKTFSDLKFFVDKETKPIYAHKVIISCRCPILLQSKSGLHQVNSSGSEITAFNTSTPVFLAFLNYLYTDSLHCEKSLLSDLITLCDRYGVLRLKKLCLDRTVTFGVQIPDSAFKEDMRKALKSTEFSDVTFVVEQQPIHSYRTLLMQHEYFRAMFSVQLRESSQKEIPILNVGYEAFKSLISYCTTFAMNQVPGDSILELFVCSSMFMLEGLRHACEATLCAGIDKHNVCSLFQLADTHKSLFLKEECFDFIILHHKELIDSEDYKQLSEELKQEIADYLTKKQIQLARAREKKSVTNASRDQNYSLLEPT